MTRLLLALSVFFVAGAARADDFFDALNKGDVDAVTKLLAADKTLANKPKNGAPPLHVALLGNNVKIVQLLIEAGADIHALDRVGGAPIHYAAVHRDRAMLELLLDKGAKVDAPVKGA